MSMLLMVQAMRARVGNPLRKLVLIKLADNANDEGECWPSYQHIADQCEISRSTVKVHIRELEKAGLLRREFRRVGEVNQSNIFHLTLDGGAAENRGGAADTLPGAAAAPGGGAAAAPRTSHLSEPVKEPVNGSSAPRDDDGFEAVWKAYPKREGANPKNKAHSAWKARLKEGVKPEDMIAGLLRYQSYCRAKGSIGTEYVMQAQRFFGPSREFENEWAVAGVRTGKPHSRHHGLDDLDYGSGAKETVIVGGF